MTKNGIIVEEGEYLYKEGSYKAKVIVEKVLESTEWIRLKVFFPEKNERMVICNKNENFSNVGTWRLLDWTKDSEKEVKQANKPRHKMQPPDIFKPGYRKEGLFKALDENKLADILIHFNSIYNCRVLGEKEMNLVWLSWVHGKGLLHVSESLIIYPFREVEFEPKDYEISDENETSGGINLELTMNFYQLDKLYEEVLESIFKN